jgi:hypothetical protein
VIERKEWYSNSEIIPTVDQLTDFVLPNLPILRDGYYPNDPREIGRPGCGDQRNARFIPAAELAAEIDYRMSKLRYSIALTLCYSAQPGWTIQQVAFELHMDEEELQYEIYYMLKYIAGSRRKAETYADWKFKYKARKGKKGILYPARA